MIETEFSIPAPQTHYETKFKEAEFAAKNMLLNFKQLFEETYLDKSKLDVSTKEVLLITTRSLSIRFGNQIQLCHMYLSFIDKSDDATWYCEAKEPIDKLHATFNKLLNNTVSKISL